MEQQDYTPKTLGYKTEEVALKFRNGYYYITGCPSGFVDRASALRELSLRVELEKLKEFKKKVKEIKKLGISKGPHVRTKAIHALEKEQREWYGETNTTE
jgi:hypothetical protein